MEYERLNTQEFHAGRREASGAGLFDAIANRYSAAPSSGLPPSQWGLATRAGKVSLDADFGPTVGGVTSPAISALVMQADGRIVIGGNFSRLSGQKRRCLARLTPGGVLDARFDFRDDGDVSTLAVQDDGKILVGGAFTTLGGQRRLRLARLDPDGSLDPRFAPEADDQVSALAVQGDGRILIGGWFTTLSGRVRNRLARLHPDGTLDRDFDPGVGHEPEVRVPWVSTLAIQPDGRILVGGNFTRVTGQKRRRIARLNPDGTLDAGFDPETDGYVYCLAVQADGRILVGGSFAQVAGQARHRIARLHPDGSLDEEFNPGADYAVASLALQTDGRILVGGAFSEAGGQRRQRLARLHPDGTLDGTLDAGANSDVTSMALQADGRILMGGRFTLLDGETRNHLARLINTQTATQRLTATDSTVTWLRGGASPEVWRTAFDHSADGVSWTPLGRGTRIPGGWELRGINPPSRGILRGRGYVAGGEYNASSWFVETRFAIAPA